jgi:hypothetical protein
MAVGSEAEMAWRGEARSDEFTTILFFVICDEETRMMGGAKQKNGERSCKHLNC